MRYLALILEELARAAIWLILGFLLAIGAAYAIAHAIDTWHADESPYTGFTPEYYTAHVDH